MYKTTYKILFTQILCKIQQMGFPVLIFFVNFGFKTNILTYETVSFYIIICIMYVYIT